MNTKPTTWLAQIVAVAVLLTAGSASASNGWLSGNSPLGKNTMEGGYYRVSASINAETHQSCGEVSRWNAAELFVAPLRVTGAFQEGAPGFAERGLGVLQGRQIVVTESGLARVEQHLAQFGPWPENAAMVQRLRGALANGGRVSGADASFYLHEVYESTLMGRGILYDAAHSAALNRYGVSAYSVYHPNVINALPGTFNANWLDFWAEMAKKGVHP